MSARANAVSIRAEQRGDRVAIADVITDAFRDVAHSDQQESAIVDALREEGALTLSLVAVEEGIVLGHAAFSPVMIDGEDRGWFGLGPISILPHRQREGLGSALIRKGLELLGRRNAAGCVLLGEPAYYRRFGFEHDDRLRYQGAPAAYFLHIGLNGDALPTAWVTYHPAIG